MTLCWAVRTFEEMKGRPVGKADYSCRSCLHDDITCVILHFVVDPAMETEVAALKR